MINSKSVKENEALKGAVKQYFRNLNKLDRREQGDLNKLALNIIDISDRMPISFIKATNSIQEFIREEEEHIWLAIGCLYTRFNNHKQGAEFAKVLKGLDNKILDRRFEVLLDSNFLEKDTFGFKKLYKLLAYIKEKGEVCDYELLLMDLLNWDFNIKRKLTFQYVRGTEYLD